MPYADKAQQREYQKHWMRMRRAEFFDGKACVICGSTHKLRLHHRIPSAKDTHKVWSWTENKRNEELKKCDVVCHWCHNDIHQGRRYV